MEPTYDIKDGKAYWTLDDYLMDLCIHNKKDELAIMVKIYGRERVLCVWKKYQELKYSSLK